MHKALQERVQKQKKLISIAQTYVDSLEQQLGPLSAILTGIVLDLLRAGFSRPL